MSITVGHENLHAVVNTYHPGNSQTSFTIPVPYFDGTSVNTIPITFVTSATTVTTSTYANSDFDTGNTMWEMTSYNGWAPAVTDGNYTTGTGIACYASYQFEGTVTSSFNAPLNGSGSIRYQYVMGEPHDESSVVILHMTASTRTAYSSIEIIP